MVPQAPLGAEALYTVTISGVTDQAGNAVTPLVTSFETGAGPDITPPTVLQASPSGTDVPVNSVVVVEFSEPIDPATLTESSLTLRNETTYEYVAASRSLDVTGRVAYLMPTGPLAVNTQHRIRVTSQVQDVAGNDLTYFSQYFTTAFTEDEVPPELVLVDPPDSTTDVAINAQVTVQISEAVDPISVSASTVTVEESSTPVEGTLSLEDGNRRLRWVPTLPLEPWATHTLTLADLRDVAGNVMTGPVVSSFTTEEGADLTKPQVVATNPTNGSTGIVRDVVMTVEFSEPINPMTLASASVRLRNTTTSQYIDLGIVVDPSRTIVLLTPTELLASNSSHTLYLYSGITDTADNPLQSFPLSFTTE